MKQKQTSAREDESITFSKEKKDFLRQILVIALIPFLLYLKTINFKLTGFDDQELITENISFLKDFSNLPAAFTKEAFISKAGHFYRPMQTVSYMIDIHLLKANPERMIHFTNVLLLAVIACLLFCFFKKLAVSPKISLLASLLYCIHPLFVSSVCWLPSRGDLLLTAFSLTSFIYLIDFLQTRQIKFIIVHIAAFIFALFSKETAAALPLVFIAYYFLLNSEKHWRLLLTLITLYMLPGIFWFSLRSDVTGNYNNPNDLVGINALVQNFQIIPESITCFLIPLDIQIFPVFSSIKTIGGLMLIAVIVWLYSKNQTNAKKEMLFGLIWFLVLLFPSLFFKNTMIDYLNHRLILPLIGLLIFACFLVPVSWHDNKGLKKTWIVALVIGVLGTTSFSKSADYKDPMTFYKAATAKNSGSALAHYNMGNIYKNIGNSTLALVHFNKAIEMFPSYYEAYNNRGNTYVMQHQYKIAINDYNMAIKLNSAYADAYYDRGIAYKNMGNLDSAIVDYTKAIELDAHYYKAYNNRGFVYYNRMEFDKAIDDYSKSIQINNDYARAYYNRATAYYKKGLIEKACADFKKSGELGISDAFESLAKYCN